MLNVNQVGKAYGGRTLLRDVSFHVNRNDRIGLIGPNGSGKSTIFRLILGQIEPDAGTVALRPGARMGHLPQEMPAANTATALETATAITPEIAALQNVLRTAGVADEAALAARARLDELRIFELEPKAQKHLAGLGFKPDDCRRPLQTLSGGWGMRAHLARLLTQAPDLLMLDEPTNHLDLAALDWLQEYLSKYTGAILMISHDREFLNRVVTRIFEIRQAGIQQYHGNYDAYVIESAARHTQQLAAYNRQQREIAALQRFADRFRAKASKAAQAQSKLKQIARMDQIAPPPPLPKTIAFHWPQPPRSGQRVMTLRNIHQAYGGQIVYQALNYEVERGQRTVLVGPNGAGKSTLLKILAGIVPFQSGEREPGLHVKIGYYAQHRLEMLHPRQTVLEEARQAAPLTDMQTTRTVLGAFLFRGDDVFKPVSVLSGGEKSRLALVKLLLDPPNLLLMDEPTTHLDIPGMDALAAALRHYQGTLLFISHDVYFIRAIANTVLHIHDGALTPFAGNYDYYIERTRAASARAALTAGGPAGVGPAPAPAARSICQPRIPTRRAQQKRLAGLEKQIAELERQQAALADLLADPATYTRPGGAREPTAQLAQTAASLEALYAQWESLSTAGNLPGGNLP